WAPNMDADRLLSDLIRADAQLANQARPSIFGSANNSNHPMPAPTDKPRADQARKHDPTRVRPILFAPQYWFTWIGLSLLRVIEPLPYPFLMALGRTIGRIMRRLPLPFTRIARV